jgi:hypothetical protein
VDGFLGSITAEQRDFVKAHRIKFVFDGSNTINKDAQGVIQIGTGYVEEHYAYDISHFLLAQNLVSLSQQLNTVRLAIGRASGQNVRRG